MSLAEHVSRSLASKSSRRQFFKFMGASSLGTGLFFTRTGISVGAVTGGGCVGCGGGPCNSCWSPAPRCENLPTPYPCKTCQQGGGCPVGCSTSGEWFCCVTGTQCRQRCSECNCPPGCANLNCYCFTMTAIPCVPRSHSGDQPCPCAPPPLVGVTADAA